MRLTLRCEDVAIDDAAIQGKSSPKQSSRRNDQTSYRKMGSCEKSVTRHVILGFNFKDMTNSNINFIS